MREWLSKENTTAVNGFFICVVFLSHLGSYTDLAAWLTSCLSYIGQMMVVMFMFYSGFGVGESIRKKGMKYVKSMPKNRIFRVWSHFAIAVTLYLVLGLITGRTMSGKNIFLSYLAWEDLGNSNWYIFAILGCYLATVLGCLTLGRKLDLLASILYLTAFICFLHAYKEPWWYNTIPAYGLGLIFSWKKCKEWNLWNRKVLVGILALASLLLWIGFHRLKGNLGLYLVMEFFFVLMILCLTCLLPVSQRGMLWLGKHLFEIYILMRIPMIILKKAGITNPWLMGGISGLATLLMAWGFHKLLQKKQKQSTNFAEQKQTEKR
ncbi:MAG: hypothetical protein K6G62_00310 [Eubacterium sp.]|nr:hypothetical protein [Eubacterium sp.]